MTGLGGILFSDWTHPVTGEPVPRSSTSFTSTRATQTRACKHRHGDIAAGTRTDTSTQGTQDTSAHATETPIVGRSLDGCGGPRRQVLEVASFVPGHVRNRGATPWSWTALCSKKNKVATPLHSNRMERQPHVVPFLGSHAADHVSKRSRWLPPTASMLSLLQPPRTRRGRPGKNATTAVSLQNSTRV